MASRVKAGTSSTRRTAGKDFAMASDFKIPTDGDVLLMNIRPGYSLARFYATSMCP